MNITVNNNQNVFTAKFINNEAFRDVIKYAQKNKQLQELDSALNIINNAEGKYNDIVLIHGKSPNGDFYSCFQAGKRSISNVCSGSKSPEEASFNGIITLSGGAKRSLKSLLGGTFREQISEKDIIKKYCSAPKQ